MKTLEQLGISPVPWNIVPYGERTNSKVATHGDVEFANGESAFLKDAAKAAGGFIEPLYLDRSGLVMLVDEDGYEKKLPVNKTASLIYNKVFNAEHFILGTVVFCYIDRDGANFENIPVGKATMMEQYLMAMSSEAEKVEVPYPLPEPKVEIVGFDSTEQMIEYLKGGSK